MTDQAKWRCHRRLLEFLRQNREQYDAMHARQRKELIVQHHSEFPSKLRAVVLAISVLDPLTFERELYQASKALFFGRFYDKWSGSSKAGGTSNDSNSENAPFDWWHGLNSDVDTEDEVEVVIRLFPRILKVKSQGRTSYPILAMLECSKALPFVPLFAELGAQLDGPELTGYVPAFGEGLFGGSFRPFPGFGVSEEATKARVRLMSFREPPLNILLSLIGNHSLRDRPNESDPSSIDEIYTQILQRLRDKGLIKRSNVSECNLVDRLLWQWRWRSTTGDGREKRLRFLIEWDPSILVGCKRDSGVGNFSPLICHYIADLSCWYQNPELALEPPFRCLQILFELGMSHYPDQLGFLFHREAVLVRTFEIFGNVQVTRLIDDELRKIMSCLGSDTTQESLEKDGFPTRSAGGSSKNIKHNPFQALVLSVAANKEISLSGVYTLFRYDPMAVMGNTAVK